MLKIPETMLETIPVNVNRPKLDLSMNSLGKLIKIIWREKYRNRALHFVNLKIEVEYHDRRQINRLDQKAL